MGRMDDSATDFEGWQDAAPGEMDTKDGWSFEVDEDDVNKILSQEEEDESPGIQSEERTALEDIFRFDSEMAAEDEEEDKLRIDKGNKVSVDDLSDALRDETDSEAETGERAAKFESTDEEASCGEQDKPTSSAVLGSSFTGTSSCSEGSVSNSPNPRANKPKGKNKKKK